MDGRHTYIAIDLKSFYASVECMERGLDPLRTVSYGGRRDPYRKDHLPGSVSGLKVFRDPGTAQAL